MAPAAGVALTACKSGRAGVSKQLKDAVMSSPAFLFRQKHLGPFKPIKCRIFIEGNLLSYLNST